ncbi:hypothetical protein [Rhizobium paknamense]|uniref:Uncharacterized protein n=1 Tax=Rhizobium paknamense TaxID=1206817 RepID=A0ABU0IAJ2_9HYPH|nr:hypothetical protein [Rhizobium paknamense]MDQ0454254.1 hypothetical protein [Rhizobium paknamense]
MKTRFKPLNSLRQTFEQIGAAVGIAAEYRNAGRHQNDGKAKSGIPL